MTAGNHAVDAQWVLDFVSAQEKLGVSLGG